jgi:hypothetical protein
VNEEEEKIVTGEYGGGVSVPVRIRPIETRIGKFMIRCWGGESGDDMIRLRLMRDLLVRVTMPYM